MNNCIDLILSVAFFIFIFISQILDFLYRKVSIFISERSLWNMSRQHTGYHEIDVNTLNQLHKQGEAISPILKEAWCLDVNIVSTDVFPFVFRGHLAAHEWTGAQGEGGGGKGGGDHVEKVGRTSGKIMASPLPKPGKTTGVLRNVVIICMGSYFQESADQESFMTEWKLLVRSNEKKSENSVSGRSVKCNAIFAVCDLSALWALICSPVWIQYMETPC